jgi:single-strand DNA-binding protein
MTNIVLLCGNLGKDPDVRDTQGGKSITSFSIATSRPNRDADGKIIKDKTGYTVTDDEWHRITCFNGLGKTVADFCKKGMKVMVRGRIHYGKYTDKEGVERYTTEIIADQVDFLTRPKGQDQANQDDDIPFE